MHDFMTSFRLLSKSPNVGQLMCIESGQIIAFYMIECL